MGAPKPTLYPQENRALEPANQKDLTPERLSYFSRWVNAEVRLLSQLGDAAVLFGAVSLAS